MSLGNNLLKVLSANSINLISSVVSGLLIPAFLDVEQYGLLKTYTLYLSYVGILHLGFVDGLYLKYGGEKLSAIPAKNLSYEHNFLLVFQLILSVIIIIAGFLTKEPIIILLSLAVVPTNLKSFYLFIFQATGEFGLFSRVKVLIPIVTLSLNLVLIFVLKHENYMFFIAAQLIANFIGFIYLEYTNLIKRKHWRLNLKQSWQSHKDVFKVGVFILAGNFLLMLFYSIDRWFVKLNFTLHEFAYYSFAVSLMMIIMLIITSITMTFYPYLARNNDAQSITIIKGYLLITGTIGYPIFFVLKILTLQFIPKYANSLDVLGILFSGIPVIIIINALYINLYKSKKQERKFLITVLINVLISFIANSLVLYFFHSVISIAVATTATFYLWYIYSSTDFDGLEIRIKEVIFHIISIAVFIICIFYINSYISLLVSLVTIIVLDVMFYKKELLGLIKRLTSFRLGQ